VANIVDESLVNDSVDRNSHGFQDLKGMSVVDLESRQAIRNHRLGHETIFLIIKQIDFHMGIVFDENNKKIKINK
jgi:hypothetical protein